MNRPLQPSAPARKDRNQPRRVICPSTCNGPASPGSSPERPYRTSGLSQPPRYPVRRKPNPPSRQWQPQSTASSSLISLPFPPVAVSLLNAMARQLITGVRFGTLARERTFMPALRNLYVIFSSKREKVIQKLYRPTRQNRRAGQVAKTGVVTSACPNHDPRPGAKSAATRQHR